MGKLGQSNIETVIQEINSKYLLQVKRILISKAYIFTKFREATIKEDQELGFDAVLSFPDTKIPIRIRKEEYIKYSDFTVRSKSRSGGRTEIDKIRDGFGDFYFYAWSDESIFKKENNKIISYMILDLNIFRSTIVDKPTKNNMANGDGTSFHIYSKQILFDNKVVKIFEYL